MMKNLIDIIKDEFDLFRKESGAMLIMIIGVVAYSIFYMLPYSSEIIKEAPIGVVDFDGTKMSHEFIRNLNATDSVDIVSRPVSIDEAKHQFYKGEIKGYVIVPRDFQKEIKRGSQAVVSTYADSSYLIIYKTIYSAVVQTAINYGAKIEIGKLLKKGMSKDVAMTVKQPFEFVQVPLYNPAGGYETYVYPVILILILHQTLVVGIGLMQGTRHELKENYCKKEEDIPITLFGRCTAYVLLYMFYSIFYFLIYPAIGKYPMSYNLLPLILMLIPMFYGAGFFSHTISYYFKKRESSLLILVVTSLIFIFLPGLIWPKEAIPQWLNIIAYFIPATCGVDGIIKVDQMNATFWNVRYDFLWLIFLCGLYFASSIYVIKKKFNKNDLNEK